MDKDEIVVCQCCGENIFLEDAVQTKNGLICKACENPNYYRFKSFYCNEQGIEED